MYRCEQQCPLAMMTHNDDHQEKLYVKRDAYDVEYGSSRETIIDVSEPATIVQSCVCVPPTDDNSSGSSGSSGSTASGYNPMPFNPLTPNAYPSGANPDSTNNSLPQGCGSTTTGFFTDTGTSQPSPIGS